MIRSLRVALACLVIVLAGACVADETASPIAVTDGRADPLADDGDLAHADRDDIGVADGHSRSHRSAWRRRRRSIRAWSRRPSWPTSATREARCTVTVTSAAAERIDELVLRWPTELN